MDIRNWCNSGCKTVSLGRGYYDYDYEIGINSASTNSNGTGISNKLNWKLLWLKLKKEKRKMFESGAVQQVAAAYDPYTYSQNFDQGFAWDEPDNLSRSFSMRFAHPSTVFLRQASV